MLNFEQIRYSIMHRDVVKLLAKKYVDNEFLERVKYHDMDKVLLYLQESITLAHSKHLKYLSHHLESNIEKSKDDYIETIIDWDSARYTKPDKLLNAYQTLKKFYPKFYGEIFPIIRELNLDHEYVPLDNDILHKIASTDYTEEYCLNEIIEYVRYVIDNNIDLYYDIYEVLSNAFFFLEHDEKDYLKKKLGDEIMNRININEIQDNLKQRSLKRNN